MLSPCFCLLNVEDQQSNHVKLRTSVSAEGCEQQGKHILGSMNKMDLDCFGNLRFFFLLRYKNDMMICFISLPNPHQLLLLLFFPSSFLSSFAFSSTAISHYTSASCSSSAFASFSSPSVCSNSSVSHSAHPPLFCFFDVFCFFGLPVELFFIILTQDSRLTQSFKRLKIVFHSGRKHSGSYQRCCCEKVERFNVDKQILLQTPLGGHGWRLFCFCRFHRLLLLGLVESILRKNKTQLSFLYSGLGRQDKKSS